MRTEDIVIDDSSYRQLIEQPIDPVEERILVFYVLLELKCAFVSEAHVLVYLTIFMGSPQQHDILRELYL